MNSFYREIFTFVFIGYIGLVSAQIQENMTVKEILEEAALKKSKILPADIATSSVISERPISVKGDINLLYIVDGKKMTEEEVIKIPSSKIESITVINSEAATKLYDKEGENGAILIELKSELPTNDGIPNKESFLEEVDKKPIIAK